MPQEIDSVAGYLARKIHYEGSVSRIQVERMLSGASRRISLDQVLDHAVSQRWVGVNGSRISPGEACPELQTSARYAVPPDKAR